MQDQPNQRLGRLALVSLGSNAASSWGDPASTVQKAMLEISNLAVAQANCSDLFATAAFPADSGPDFVNAALALHITAEPAAFLADLHAIENAAGRERHVRWGQRTLDLDLLACDDVICPDIATFTHWRDLPMAAQMKVAPDRLILPHPRLQDRAFVLIPLAQVAPDWVHPVSGLAVRAMRAALPASAAAEVRPIGPRDETR
ncbi:MAG: 2-amino-4-hydroxy-6-hydroxymethyldihydropteridine diphosphokinase [Pseudomonadota bacterium]